jgi:carbonic anhydrase
LSFISIAAFAATAFFPGPAQASTSVYQSPLQTLQASWSYEGATGPAFWGDLDAAFAACSTGEQQSPINFSYQRLVPAKWALSSAYEPTAFSVNNNGHTIQADVAGTTNSAFVLDDVEYTLAQFHFHTPSEHTVDANSFEMELHLVHMDEDENLAVLGVLIEEGTHNDVLEEMWTLMPTEEGVAAETIVLNPEELLPQEIASFQYNGSLTTPPCDEGVKWTVIDQPIELSHKQIERFQSIYPQNYRPVQDLGNRDVGYHYH